ncbi:MAG: pyruvate synthase subunit PorB [Eudoraea sp.]|nr:pyruvate synthase subunit PorB [Eudoraea sp.]
MSGAAERIRAKNIPEFEAIASGHRGCQGCGEVLAMRLAMKAVGENMIVVNATGCMEVITSPFPHTAWNVPWIHVAFENAGAVGSGVSAAIKALQRKGRYKNDDTKVIIVGGDGGTSDIGFQSLSGALERNHDFVYICFDNEAYMNTGIQRSSATPTGAWTTTSPIGAACEGKKDPKKDLVAIFANHGIPYVATATPAHHLDLMNKVRKAANMPGPAFIHVFSPCPTGWKMPTSSSIDVCKTAVKSNLYPLFEIIDGKYVMGPINKKPIPVIEYLKSQGRFKHLSESQIECIQYEVDKRYKQLIRWSEEE